MENVETVKCECKNSGFKVGIVGYILLAAFNVIAITKDNIFEAAVIEKSYASGVLDKAAYSSIGSTFNHIIDIQSVLIIVIFAYCIINFIRSE